MYRKSALLTLSLSLAITTGCKSPEQKAAEEATRNLQEASAKMAEATKNGQAPNVGDAMNALGAAMGAANGGKKVETVDYKVLKDMLPADLSGMKRSEATGEKSSAMGITIANCDEASSMDNHNSCTIDGFNFRVINPQFCTTCTIQCQLSNWTLFKDRTKIKSY